MKRVFLVVIALLLIVGVANSAKINDIWTGFQGGELSPYLDGQVGLDQYRIGTHKMINFIPLVQGPAIRRPGTRFVNDTKNGPTETARLIPFIFSDTDAYLLEFGVDYIRYYKDGGLITSIPNAWTLLLHGEGDDASTTITDSSNVPHTATLSNDVQIDTAYKKFGSASILFDGTNDYFTEPDGSEFDFSDLEYTIGLWVLPRANTAPMALFSIYDGASDYYSLELDTWTVLLMHGYWQSQDSSVYNHTDSSGNKPTITHSQYKFTEDGGWAHSFDAVDDHQIFVPSGSEFDLSDTYTISIWFYASATQTTSKSVGLTNIYEDANNYAEIFFTCISSPASTCTLYWKILDGGSGSNHVIANFTTAAWHLIEISGNGTNCTAYLDGTRKFSYIPSENMPSSVAKVEFGLSLQANGTYFKGYMDDVRLLKAREMHASTASYTVPTSPYRAMHPKLRISSTADGADTLEPDAAVEESIELKTTPSYPVEDFAHIEVNGDLSKHYLFVNGVLQNTGGTAMSADPQDFTADPEIGGLNSGTEDYNGWIDELIVATDDSIQHTSGFTPRTVAYGLDASDGTPVETVTTYAESELQDLQYVQSGDTMIIVHPSHAPATLTRTSDVGWTLGNITFQGQPSTWAAGSYPNAVAFYEERLWFAYGQTMWASNTADFYNMTPYGTMANYAGTVDSVAYTAVNIATNYITVAESADWPDGTPCQISTTGTLPGPLEANTIYYTYDNNVAAADTIKICTTRANAISGTCIDLTSQGSGTHTITQWAECTGDSCGLQYTIAANKANDIRWISPGKVMVVGTEGGEYKVSSSKQEEAITPTNVRIIEESGYGSKDIMPLTIRDVTLYVQRGGEKVREFTYQFESDRYVSPDLTLLAEHITDGGIAGWAYMKNPWSTIWAYREDGTLIGMTYARENDTVAWHEHLLGGTTPTVESIAVLPDTNGGVQDRVYFLVKRYINGAWDRYIEVMDSQTRHGDLAEDAFYVDSGLSYSGASKTDFEGMDHLEGETVEILADGVPVDDETISSGAFSIDSAASKVHAGLGYTSTLQTMRWNGSGTYGTLQGQPKRINKIVLRVENALDLNYGHTPDTTLNSKSWSNLYTGDITLEMPLGIHSDGYVTVTVDEPVPLDIIAIIPEVNFN